MKKNLIYYVKVAVICGFAAFPAPENFGQPQNKESEIILARMLLTDVSIHSDTTGIVQARERFRKILGEAEAAKDIHQAALAHYFIAFSNFQLLYVTYGQKVGGKQLLEEALIHLDAAIQSKPDFIDAYTLSAICQTYLSRFNRDKTKKYGELVEAYLEKARTLEPEHPQIIMAEVFPLLLSNQSRQVIDKIDRALVRIESAREPGPQYTDWWRVTAYFWKGSIYSFQGQREKARELFEKCLQIRPDFEFVYTRLPTTELLQPRPVAYFEDMRWQLLATDPVGDGSNPALPDARTLSFFYDTANDTVWFKFEMNHFPNPDTFGVNLVLDSDGDSSTGMTWWGGDTSLKFDKLVSLWVSRVPDGRYHGIVGVSDWRSIRIGRYTKLSYNNLAFGIDRHDSAVIIGMKHSELHKGDAFALFGAVGSNQVWNDNILNADNSGFIEIELSADME